jgi:hypothetical protein
MKNCDVDRDSYTTTDGIFDELENIAGLIAYKLIDNTQLDMPEELHWIDADQEWVTGTKCVKLKILCVSQSLRDPSLRLRFGAREYNGFKRPSSIAPRLLGLRPGDI